MNGFSALSGLLAPSAAPTADDILSLYLGRTLDEVSDWPNRPDVMIDGLDRTRCHDAVEGRALAITGDPLLAVCVAEMISTIVPLATSLHEIDAAIDMAASWMTRLQSDHLLTRIVDAKTASQNDPLRLVDPERLDPAQREALAGLDEEIEEYESEGTLVLSLGGLDAVFTVEIDCIMVVVQCEPGSDEFLVMYSFQHVENDDGDGDWNDGRDPEPEPENGPRPLATV